MYFLKKNVKIELLLILSSLVSVVMLQNLSALPVKASMPFMPLNVILLYVLYKLMYLVFGRVWISIPAVDLILFCFGTGNYYVNQFRGVMILPWDLLAVRTAADVIGSYRFTFYLPALLWFLLLAVKTALLIAGRKKGAFPVKRGLVYTAISLVICAGLVFSVVNTEKYKSIPDRLYLIERYYKTQGIPVSFFHYCKFLYTPKPEGYSAQKCEEAVALGSGDSETGSQVTQEPVNVIVIMNESFADFSEIGSIPEIEECLSFTNSLKEDTVRGNLYVPVYGGTTVNTEYEFLTGNSTAFMKGCPFSYAVREDRPSVPRVFSERGYEIHSMHPAQAQNWNRKSVYPFLGMEDFLSLEQLEKDDPELINDHTTDAWNYGKVIELYENKSQDKFFLFNVTMQNHSGYNFDFEEESDQRHVDLSGYEVEEGELKAAENYLSLLNMSDKALEGLVEYFSGVEEPTMICMFGDHQPKLDSSFYTLLNGGEPIDTDDPTDNIRMYTTPFLIWANYDIPEETYEGISCNYLPEILMRNAFCEIPPYYRFLGELREKYPILSTNGVYDSDGNFYSVDEIQKREEILNYRYLEYNNASEKSSRILWQIFR